MKVTVNDEVRQVPENASLATLVAELGLSGKAGLALAVNGVVVPTARWEEHILHEGDGLLLIQATQGG